MRIDCLQEDLGTLRETNTPECALREAETVKNIVKRYNVTFKKMNNSCFNARADLAVHDF
jgi:hypothetical protein